MFCTVWPGAGINVSECLALVVRMVLQLVAALAQPCFIGTETVCIKLSIFIRLWHSMLSWLVEEGRWGTVLAAATSRSEARAWVVLKDVRCLNCLLVNTGHYQLTSFPCWHVVATFGLSVIYKIADVFHHFSLRVCVWESERLWALPCRRCGCLAKLYFKEFQACFIISLPLCVCGLCARSEKVLQPPRLSIDWSHWLSLLRRDPAM